MRRFSTNGFENSPDSPHRRFSSGQTWSIVLGPWKEQHDLVKAQQSLGMKVSWDLGMKVSWDLGMKGLGWG